jgi:hypothetical protein
MERGGRSSRVNIEGVTMPHCSAVHACGYELGGTFLNVVGNLDVKKSNMLEDLCANYVHEQGILVNIEMLFDCQDVVRKDVGLYQLMRFERVFDVGSVQQWKAKFKLIGPLKQIQID